MNNVVHIAKTWVKIRRDGEKFWLGEIRTENGTKTGVVDNHLAVAPYQYGQRIEFKDAEVLDVMTTTNGQRFEQ